VIGYKTLIAFIRSFFLDPGLFTLILTMTTIPVIIGFFIGMKLLQILDSKVKTKFMPKQQVIITPLEAILTEENGSIRIIVFEDILTMTYDPDRRTLFYTDLSNQKHEFFIPASIPCDPYKILRAWEEYKNRYDAKPKF
ncbi:MAG: hypothetical protein AABZ92_03605, partial [Verrucomicrobiota bacterium]